MDLIHYELEVRDCGNVQLECFNFKLQNEGSKNKQKMDKTLKMESHAKKSKVLPCTKMLPCATICRTKHLRNLILGTSWLPSEFQTHFVASTQKLYAPCSWQNTQASKIFQ
jgi:hypothetical protein